MAEVDKEVAADITTAVDAAIEAKSEVAVDDKKVEDTKVSDEPFVEDKSVVEDKPIVDEKPIIDTKPKLSNMAITRAIRAGLSLEDAQAFTNDEALNRVSANIEDARKPVVEDEEEVVDEDILSEFPTLDPEEYEDGVIKAFDSMKNVVRKQQEIIKQLQTNQSRMSNAGRVSADQETTRWFDSRIANLGPDYEEVLGKGGYNDIVKSSPQFAKRESIANQAAILIAGYKSIGQSFDRDEVFNQAAKLVLSDDIKKIQSKKVDSELDKVNADLNKRSKQHIQRANTKAGKPKGNVMEEISAMLDSKYFGKT